MTTETDQRNVATGPETAGAEKEDAAKADWTKLPAATPVAKRDWLRPGDPGGGPDYEERDVSPNDKLMWAAMQDEREVIYPHLSDLARRRRGKKRARSSSPTSSPMGKTSSPIINVKKLAQALKSPHPDPTLELWDRYSLSGVGETTPHDASTTGLNNNLFATSSPRPVGRNPNATPQKESALRRAIMSSRLDFNKRRKIEVEEDAPGDTRDAASKFSLVTSLLDSVTSSIQEPQENQEASPLSNKENTRQDPGSDSEKSPSPRKRMRSSPPSSPPCSKSPRTAQAEAEAAGLDLAPPDIAGPIDDFGDDDFDDDIFIAIDTQVGNTPVMSCGDARGAAVAGQPAPDPVKPTTRPQPRRSPRKSPRKNVYPPQAMLPAQAAATVAVDDYGLDDDDIDDDTLMELADQAAPTNSAVPVSLGSKTKSAPKTHAPAPATAGTDPFTEDGMFDDDEFGDDADWDAVELAATQAAASQPSGAQPGPRASNLAGPIPVCHHGRPEGFV